MLIIDWSSDVCSSDLHQLHLAAAGRVRAEGLERLDLGARAAAPAIGGVGDARDRRVHADLEDFGGAGQLRLFAVVEQIGAVAPQPRPDSTSAFISASRRDGKRGVSKVKTRCLA